MGALLQQGQSLILSALAQNRSDEPYVLRSEENDGLDDYDVDAGGVSSI